MRIITFIFLLFLTLYSKAQVNFDTYYTTKSLRFDFLLAGNSSKTDVYPLGMKVEPFWAGSKKNLKDPFTFGNFRYELIDQTEGILIYSKGFCTLYQEWQTTAEANSTDKSFYEVATMPLPKRKAKFVLSIRQRDGKFEKLFETVIDPDNYFILNESPRYAKTTMISGGGDPSKSVDLAFIAEGYMEDEMAKFREDVKRLADVLLSEAPFDKFKDRFNIWAVEAVSQESGTDVPGENIYVNTALNSGFYTFDVDRYLTTQDIKSVNDYAALVPHDNIIVLINSSRYGGGGVYNYYSGTTADHALSPKVFVHEFGHGFAGLADEYYSSTVAYDEFYPLDVEPWEPNITTLVDFDTKWKSAIESYIPLPTPQDVKFENETGLFEGGGYSAKGIYRPEMECRMKSNGQKGFCKVCQKAIEEMIVYYIEK